MDPLKPLPDYSKISMFPLSKIKTLLLGPFFQYVRVEIDPTNAFVLLMRSHKETENFVAFTKAAAKKLGLHIGILPILSPLLIPVESLNKNQEMVSKLQPLLAKRESAEPRIELYLHLFERTKTSSIVTGLPPGKGLLAFLFT